MILLVALYVTGLACLIRLARFCHGRTAIPHDMINPRGCSSDG